MKIQKIFLFFAYICLYNFSIRAEYKVSKGALIEAIFILQNKYNSLAEYAQNSQFALKLAQEDLKKYMNAQEFLDYTYAVKQNNVKKLYEQKNKKINPGIVRRIHIVEEELEKIKAKKEYNDVGYHQAQLLTILYPDYLKQLDFFLTTIRKPIDRFSVESDSTTEEDIKHEVKKADILKDIAEKQLCLLELMFTIGNKHIMVAHHKEHLNNQQHMLDLLQEALKIFPRSTRLQRSVKVLKKELIRLPKITERVNKTLPPLLKNYESTKIHLKELSEQLAQIIKEDDNLWSKPWFIPKLNELQQKLHLYLGKQ